MTLKTPKWAANFWRGAKRRSTNARDWLEDLEGDGLNHGAGIGWLAGLSFAVLLFLLLHPLLNLAGEKSKADYLEEWGQPVTGVISDPSNVFGDSPSSGAREVKVTLQDATILWVTMKVADSHEPSTRVWHSSVTGEYWVANAAVADGTNHWGSPPVGNGHVWWWLIALIACGVTWWRIYAWGYDLAAVRRKRLSKPAYYGP
jgi:hypothetical protein